MNSTTTHVTLDVQGMNCASCVHHVEKALNALHGVSARVNFATKQAMVDCSENIDEKDLLAAVSQAGYGARIARPSMQHDHHHAHAEHERHLGLRLILAVLLSLPFVVEMGLMFAGQHGMSGRVQWILAALVMILAGESFHRSAWKALRHGTANMDTLVVLGTSVAFAYSTCVLLLPALAGRTTYFEASAVVLTFVLLGNYLQVRSTQRASEALTALMKLQPTKVWRETPTGLQEIPIAQLHVGDAFVVRPGDSVPADGVVSDGRSNVNEAMLTGESLPVGKKKGDRLMAGTVNQEGLLRVQAANVGEETRLAQMVRLVAEAQGSKAPVQRMTDAVAARFVPAVLVIAVLTLAGWWWVGRPDEGLIHAVAVLVIACPCALGLATPVVIIVGVGRAAQLGMLIKRAESLEKAHNLKVLAVDKTGTLTSGEPTVQQTRILSTLSADECLLHAASLEQMVPHPLAQAVVRSAQGQVLKSPSEVRVEPGLGVSGIIDGVLWRVGSLEWFDQLGIACDLADVQALRLAGHSLVMVARENDAVALFALADQLRPTTEEAVQKLRHLGIDVVMLTGDQEVVARQVADQLGLQHFRAMVQPEHKAMEIANLQKASQGQHVGMIGDGVNDAAALAQADVSFALGGGTSVAMAAADITLLGDDLRAVPQAIELSRATLRIIHQNLFFAFGYNVIGIPLAALGLITPVWSAAFMAASSVLVVANALRLKEWRPSA